jgi:16S rRNA (uracil1498-N3)-methyltransferase
MTALRALVAPGSLANGATVALEDAELHHLRVRRIAVGAEVVVLDGAGGSATGNLADDGGRLSVTVGMVHTAPAPPTTILAVGAGDRDRFLLLAERCTELGVTRLIPLVTERSQTVGSRVRDSVLERARRRAREACKQSGNPWATVVEDACTVPALALRHAATRWLLGDADGGSCPAMAPDAAIAWIIGPEGGLTPTEHQYCRVELAAERVSFGPATLRFDTAAIAAGVITRDRRRLMLKE